MKRSRWELLAIAALAAIVPGAASAQIRYFEGHKRPIQAVVYTPDGKQIISGGSDRTIKIWDRATGKLVRSIAAGEKPVMALAITRDGRRLYAADFEGTVRVYDVPRPYALPDALPLPRPATAFAFLPESAVICAGDGSGTVRLWNLAGANPVPRDYAGPGGEIAALAVRDRSKAFGVARPPAAANDSGMDVLEALADGSLAGWRIDAAGSPVGQPLGPVLTPRLGALAISRDAVVVGGGEDGLLRIFNWPPAPPINLPQHGAAVNSIVVSPDGKLFASGGADQRVMLSEAATGKLVRTLEGQQTIFGQNIPIGPIEAIAFSQDNRLVVAGGRAGLVRLWNADGTDRFSLVGHAGAVHGVAVHPDGKQVASAGADGTIRLWELPAPPAVLAPPGQAIQAFTLSADGKTAAAALADNSVNLWPMPGPKDEGPGKPAGAPPAAKPLRIAIPAPATALAIAPAGLRLATGDGIGLLRLVDPKDGKVQTILGAHNRPITALAFHPDSSRLLSAAEDGTLRLWDLAVPPPVRLAESKKPIAAVVMSSDGKFAVSGGADGVVRQFDCVSGRPIRNFVEPGLGANPPCAVTAMALRVDNGLLAAAGDNGAVRLWATADGAEQPPFAGHQGAVQAIAFSPKGDQIATVGADGTTRLWRLPAAPVPLVASAKPLRTLAVSPDGRLAAYCSEGGEVRLWNLTDGKVGAELKGQAAAVNRTAFRPDGGEIAAGDAMGNICLWNTTDGARQDLIGAHEAAVTSLVYLPGGKQLVSAGADGLLRLWQLPLPLPAKPGACPTDKPIAMMISGGAKTLGWGAPDGTVMLVDRASGKVTASLKGRGKAVSAIGLSPDESLVAVGDEDGTVRIAAAAAAQEPLALPGHKGRVTATVFHPKGTLLASAGADGTVRLWRLAVLRKALSDPAARARILAPKVEKPVAPQPGQAQPAEEEGALAQVVPVHPGGASCAVFTPDGSRLFCGAADNSVKMWNADQLAVKGQPNPPAPSVLNHTGAVTCLALSPDGQTLYAGASDKTVRVWNVGNLQVLTDLKHSGAPRRLAVSPDGARLIAAIEDGTVCVWNPRLPRPLQRFSGQSGAVLGLAFLPDNKGVVAGDAGGVLREYGISAINALVADPGKVGALALLPDGKSLASGGDDGKVKLWELGQFTAGAAEPNNPSQPRQQFPQGSGRGAVVAMTVRADGRIAAAVSGEGVFLQNVAINGGQGTPVAVPLPPAGSPAPAAGPTVVKDLAFSPDGSRLAVAIGDGRLRFYSSADGRKLEELPLPASSSWIAFPGKENHLLAAAADGRLYRCQPSLLAIEAGQNAPLTSLAYTPDGTTIIAGGNDGSIRLLKATDGTPIKALPSAGTPITALAITADGKRVIAGTAAQNAQIHVIDGSSPVTLLPHASPVRALALSRDGKRLLMGSDDREFPVRVWDVAGRRELQRAGTPGSPVLTLAVAADNKTCVTGSTDGTVWLRTLEARETIVAEKDKVLDAVFSSDGKTLLSCGDVPGVKVWDTEGKLLRTLTDPKTARTPAEPTFRRLAVSSDGRLVASADHSPGPGNRVLVWDATDGKLLHTITGPVPANCLAFSADGRKLAVGTADQQLRVFRTGDAMLLEQFAVPAPTTAAAFAPDNVTLAAAAGNSGIVLRCRLQRVLAGHQGDVTAVHYLPDGKSLLSSGADKTVRLWDVEEGKPSTTLLTASGPIARLALSRDGRRFATADADKTVRVWEFSPSTPLSGPAPAPLAAFVHGKPVSDISISTDGNRVTTACEDGLARVWDTPTGKELERIAGPPGNLLCVGFNADASAIVSGGVNGIVSRSGCSVARAIEAHRGPIRGLRFAPDGSLFSASEDKSLAQWSTGTWKAVRRYVGAADPIRQMTLSPCGRFVAAGDGPRVRLWNTADGQLLGTFETPAAVTGLALGEGGDKLLVAGADKILRNYAVGPVNDKWVASLTHDTPPLPSALGGLALAADGSTLYGFGADNMISRWWMAAGPVRFAWKALDGPIYGIRLSPDDTRLVTAGADRTPRIWNAPDGKLIAALPEHGGRVMDAAFTGDGKQLVTCGLDKTIRVFDAAGKLTRTVSEGIDGGLYTLAIATPNGAFGQVFLATSGPARTVQWWTPAADPPVRTLPGHNDAVYRAVFAPSGTRLVTLDYSGGLLIWDASGNIQHRQQLPVTAAYGVACAPDGWELAVAAQDSRLLIIKLPDGTW